MPTNIPDKPDFIDHYIILHGSPCRCCRDRKEIYAKPTNDCLECGFLRERDDPYFSLLPVWQKDLTPTEQQRDQTYAHISLLQTLPPQNLPDYCIDLRKPVPNFTI